MTEKVPVIHFLRLPDVQKRVGLQKTKIYALIDAGTFPAPIKEGRLSLWPDTEVHEWQVKRMRRRSES